MTKKPYEPTAIESSEPLTVWQSALLRVLRHLRSRPIDTPVYQERPSIVYFAPWWAVYLLFIFFGCFLLWHYAFEAS